MARKARYTKGTTMQARVADRDKAILQAFADRQGITLSELMRMTIKNLVKAVEPNLATPPTSVPEDCRADPSTLHNTTATSPHDSTRLQSRD